MRSVFTPLGPFFIPLGALFTHLVSLGPKNIWSFFTPFGHLSPRAIFFWPHRDLVIFSPHSVIFGPNNIWSFFTPFGHFWPQQHLDIFHHSLVRLYGTCAIRLLLRASLAYFTDR
jgi:hypothetical protein